MPTDHLALSAHDLATNVEAALAGTALAESPTDDIDLTDAVETYRTAGRAALHHYQEQTWFQARIRPLDWITVETTFATHIAARLDALDDAAGWWFLRKYPDWRVRVRTSNHDAVQTLLDSLVTSGVIAGWRRGIYEPETAAFGGSTATSVVHNLFCADTRGVLGYVRQTDPGLGRRELSLLLLRALQQHAGLDSFEAGDVFSRVADIRPTPREADANRVQALAMKMRPLLSIPVQADNPLFTSGGPAAYAAAWLAAHIDAGQRLGRAAAAGTLERGLRATLAHIVIFHWNRLGLSADAQGILAHAATDALLPRS